jgi:hypothetical protein
MATIQTFHDEDEIDVEMRRGELCERPRSLYRVAIHEYAHFHVAREFGIAGRVHVAPRDEGDALCVELFAGHFVPNYPLIACHATQMIALAGKCADRLREAGESASARQIYVDLCTGEATLSGGDKALAGEFYEHHVSEALAIVRLHWSAIVRDANTHAAEVKRRDSEAAG